MKLIRIGQSPTSKPEERCEECNQPLRPGDLAIKLSCDQATTLVCSQQCADRIRLAYHAAKVPRL